MRLSTSQSAAVLALLCWSFVTSVSRKCVACRPRCIPRGVVNLGGTRLEPDDFGRKYARPPQCVSRRSRSPDDATEHRVTTAHSSTRRFWFMTASASALVSLAMKLSAMALLAVASAGFSGCGGSGSQQRTPQNRLIVLGHSIGDIRLGEPRRSVEKAFGPGRSSPPACMSGRADRSCALSTWLAVTWSAVGRRHGGQTHPGPSSRCVTARSPRSTSSTADSAG